MAVARTRLVLQQVRLQLSPRRLRRKFRWTGHLFFHVLGPRTAKMHWSAGSGPRYQKGKGKGRIRIQRSLHGRTRTARFTISEVAVDWQEPVVLRRYAAYSLPALTDIGPPAAASKHTTAPISHTFTLVSIHQTAPLQAK